jgi:Tol biopolymer transport system component
MPPRRFPEGIDSDKLAEAALAILSRTLHGDGRVWNGLDWRLMDLLFEKAWIIVLGTATKSGRVAGRITGVVLAALLGACRAEHRPASSTTVLTYASPMWYEETGSYFQPSADGRLAIYGSGPRARLYAIAAGTEDPATWRRSMDQVRAGAFEPNGSLVRLGVVAGDTGWYAENGGRLTRLSIPPAALPRWTSDGSRLASFTPGDTTIAFGPPGAPATIRLDGAVNGLSWTPAGDALYAIVLHSDGLSSLEKISGDGTITVIRPHLDASPFFNSLAFSADGRTLFLALASETVPDLTSRHDPEAPHRDLDIYALDLEGGQLHVVARAPGDDCCPYVAAGLLYWTHNDPRPEVVVFPLAGGEPHAVADHGFLPRWSPDGRQIAFTRGYYRLADYGLDMDGWVVGVDSAGAVASPPRSWIAGFGEDMGPVWSPDGRWVAYHSHRSATPVPLYESPGRTDDTWLRLAAGGPEIRLTDFGFEVGPPDWSPDGRHVIFDSWDKNGVPRFAKPWIITIDPSTGQSRGATRMPLPAGVAGISGEAWSPQGAEIAFIERIDDVRRALWLSHPDGSGARKLVAFLSYTIGGVAWTPDGKELLYGGLAGDRMQIFAIAQGGGVPRQLTHDAANMMHPSVSPDGRFVAASRIPWHKELRRMTPQD